MTTATDTTMPLTPEHVGVIQLAVNSHMLRFGPELADALDRYAGKPDLVAIERIARALEFCTALLADVEHGFLHVDETGLRELLIECETEQEESADYYVEHGDNDPDTVAIIRGRAATLRVIRDLAQRRLARVQGGDA